MSISGSYHVGAWQAPSPYASNRGKMFVRDIHLFPSGIHVFLNDGIHTDGGIAFICSDWNTNDQINCYG